MRKEIRPWDVKKSRPRGRKPWWTLRCRMPMRAGIVWDETLRLMREEGVTHPVPEVEAGLIVELLAAEWLAGQRHQ